MTRFQEMCNSSSNQHEDKEEFFHLSFWKIIRRDFVRPSPIHHRQASSIEHQHDPKNTRTSPRKIFLKKEKKDQKDTNNSDRSYHLGWTLIQARIGQPINHFPRMKQSGIRNENIKRVRHAVSRSVVPPDRKII